MCGVWCVLCVCTLLFAFKRWSLTKLLGWPRASKLQQYFCPSLLQRELQEHATVSGFCILFLNYPKPFALHEVWIYFKNHKVSDKITCHIDSWIISHIWKRCMSMMMGSQGSSLPCVLSLLTARPGNSVSLFCRICVRRFTDHVHLRCVDWNLFSWLLFSCKWDLEILFPGQLCALVKCKFL